MFWTPPEGVEPLTPVLEKPEVPDSPSIAPNGSDSNIEVHSYVGIVEPLTQVLEKPEVPDSPLPYLDTTTGRRTCTGENDDIEVDEVIPPSAVPFLALFACADGLDFLLITLGSLGAVVHGASLVVYLHLFGKIIHLLSLRSNADELFDHFSQIQQNQSFDEMPTACICDLLLTTEFLRNKGKIQGISKVEGKKDKQETPNSQPITYKFLLNLQEISQSNSQLF
ncbi:hypothetical protein L2E82_27550 [Cichorium intybus]|uniref:Uncharacterized protein n=1 Tax=Cichorium intybus TaxID=13427 RepID=A0ACB9CTB3_CICIN|nr:hypothetical protein L2E82_27550 [Cichorium intybus]